MNDRQMERWDKNSGLIIEQTLFGNIRITHIRGNSMMTHTIEVEDNTVDLSAFKRSYAMQELAPAFENAGFEVVLPEPAEDESILSRIKRLIRG